MLKGKSIIGIVVATVIFIIGCGGSATTKVAAGGSGSGSTMSKSSGSGKKVKEDELKRLQEAKEAAENAEKKLSELRMERKRLEMQVNSGEKSE